MRKPFQTETTIFWQLCDGFHFNKCFIYLDVKDVNLQTYCQRKDNKNQVKKAHFSHSI